MLQNIVCCRNYDFRFRISVGWSPRWFNPTHIIYELKRIALVAYIILLWYSKEYHVVSNYDAAKISFVEMFRWIYQNLFLLISYVLYVLSRMMQFVIGSIIIAVHATDALGHITLRCAMIWLILTFMYRVNQTHIN